MKLEFAILLGVLASFIVYLRRTSQPIMTVQVPDPADLKRRFVPAGIRPECPQLCILRPDGSIWFGAVNHIRERLREQLDVEPQQRHLLLLMEGVNFVDVAGAELLAQEAERRRKLGGELYFYDLKPGVCAPLTRGDYLRTAGLRPVQIWVADTRAPGFVEECRRQSRLVSEHVGECDGISHHQYAIGCTAAPSRPGTHDEKWTESD